MIRDTGVVSNHLNSMSDSDRQYAGSLDIAHRRVDPRIESTRSQCKAFEPR